LQANGVKNIVSCTAIAIRIAEGGNPYITGVRRIALALFEGGNYLRFIFQGLGQCYQIIVFFAGIPCSKRAAYQKKKNIFFCF
jgi:hypothetical protein